jgi:hypothetical protein
VLPLGKTKVICYNQTTVIGGGPAPSSTTPTGPTIGDAVISIDINGPQTIDIPGSMIIVSNQSINVLNTNVAGDFVSGAHSFCCILSLFV